MLIYFSRMESRVPTDGVAVHRLREQCLLRLHHPANPIDTSIQPQLPHAHLQSGREHATRAKNERMRQREVLL